MISPKPIRKNKEYTVLVPQVDSVTGLSASGIKGVEVQAPLGTSIEFNYASLPSVVDLVSSITRLRSKTRARSRCLRSMK